MRQAARLAALVALSLNGCSMARTTSCFTQRHVVLPDRQRVFARLSNGQAGRELAEAVWSGDGGRATALLRADARLAGTRVEPDPRLDSQPDGQYGDLLTFAVARCDHALVEQLLDAGVPPDGGQPGAALLLALLSDDPMLPETLLSHGASPDPQKVGGENLLNGVAAANHVGGAMMLIRHGLDVRWTDKFGHTHLDDALSMQAYAIGELLVQAGADLWQADRDGFTPAHALAKAPQAALLTADDAAARERLIERAKAGGHRWPPALPAR